MAKEGRVMMLILGCRERVKCRKVLGRVEGS